MNPASVPTNNPSLAPTKRPVLIIGEPTQRPVVMDEEISMTTTESGKLTISPTIVRKEQVAPNDSRDHNASLIIIISTLSVLSCCICFVTWRYCVRCNWSFLMKNDKNVGDHKNEKIMISQLTKIPSKSKSSVAVKLNTVDISDVFVDDVKDDEETGTDPISSNDVFCDDMDLIASGPNKMTIDGDEVITGGDDDADIDLIASGSHKMTIDGDEVITGNDDADYIGIIIGRSKKTIDGDVVIIGDDDHDDCNDDGRETLGNGLGDDDDEDDSDILQNIDDEIFIDDKQIVTKRGYHNDTIST